MAGREEIIFLGEPEYFLFFCLWDNRYLSEVDVNTLDVNHLDLLKHKKWFSVDDFMCLLFKLKPEFPDIITMKASYPRFYKDFARFKA